MGQIELIQGIEYLKGLKGWVGEKDFSLGRISLVAGQLSNPQDAFRSIHVAGTNGKGSVCSTIAAILAADGYKVGITISPHIISINERISINANPVSDICLSAAAEKVRLASEQLKIELSQFEAITLCSFIIFRDEKVDYGVVEVGLGGRLDASNIISNPDITAIVSISNDHQDVLGNSLTEIAAEKAGILKLNVPCVLGELSTEVYEVISSKAAEKFAKLHTFGSEFQCKSEYQSQNLASYLYTEVGNNFQLRLNSRLLGSHQANNIGVAVRIARVLGIQNENIYRGVSGVNWPCRLEIVNYRGLNILFDCAHNSAGISSLFSYLDEVHREGDLLVFGALKTKDWQAMILGLSSKVKQWFAIEPKSIQAVPSGDIEKFISKHGLGDVQVFGSDYSSLIDRLCSLPKNTNVIVSGSIYMIGELRRELGIELKPLWQFEANSENKEANSSNITAE